MSGERLAICKKKYVVTLIIVVILTVLNVLAMLINAYILAATGGFHPIVLGFLVLGLVNYFGAVYRLGSVAMVYRVARVLDKHDRVKEASLSIYMRHLGWLRKN